MADLRRKIEELQRSTAAKDHALRESNEACAALRAQLDAYNAWRDGKKLADIPDVPSSSTPQGPQMALPTYLPTRQSCADPIDEEKGQEGNPTEILPRHVPTPATSVPTPSGTKDVSADPPPLPADSAQFPARAIASPIVIPSPPPPFYVKAIPDSLVQDSLVFKCGVLAKWHAIKEEADSSSQPPSLSESNEEIHVIEFGGERAKEEAKTGGHYEEREESTQEDSTMGEDSTRRAFAKSLRRGCPMGTREDEWIEKFGIHSGRFKLLASPLY